jgi:hypothetical protein
MFNSSSVFKFLIWPALIMGFVLTGCSPVSELVREDSTADTAGVDYSVIYYIHADADYLYHDAAGNPVRGNRQVLDTALGVAEELKTGEVFIFYQRPEKKFLGLFPRKSSQLYHYAKGELISRVNYRHSDKEEDFLTTEARLYDQYRTHPGIEYQRNYFLYFGHEIPDDEGEKYHRTNPDIAVNTGSFATGIQKFLLKDDQRFQLVVLSTCNNGTPDMAENLIPSSEVLLASPQNLHLSHIDSENLTLLDSNPGISAVELAHSMAGQTYRRLETEIQTAITLTVYDFEIVQEYKNELHAFASAQDTLGHNQLFSDNVDCNQVDFFDENVFSKGLRTWYKPARFGRKSFTEIHSGWGCKPLVED